MRHKLNIDLEPAAFYLRKSREDREAEARGEGETLTKHRRELLKLSKTHNVSISHVFEEIVSGESVIHRPEMMKLLQEVSEGKWRSVFCMEIDRLGRGDMEDQGLILRTFKQSNTLIVTPRKIYDLNDEFDEEYTEFEAFMARKELKIITRRLQGGRLRSVEDGNYLGTVPPYGYQIEKKPPRRYLVKHPEQKEATEYIWTAYRTLGIGTGKIANEINRLGYRSYTGKLWTGSSVLNILKNPAYAGIIAWKKKEIKKSVTPGKKRESRTRPRSEQLWIHEAHEAYVTLEQFDQVQEMIAKKYHPPYQLTNGITNPLAGLIKCDMCGSSMVYRPYTHQKYPHIMCYNRHCQNKSSRFEYVEARLIAALGIWLDNYKMHWEVDAVQDDSQNMIALKEKALANLKREQKELDLQKDKLHELLERGIYDDETFLERSKKLAQSALNLAVAIKDTEADLVKTTQQDRAKKDIVPIVEKMLNIYPEIEDVKTKNEMLKDILDYATYRKEKSQKGDDFTLMLYPRIVQKNI